MASDPVSWRARLLVGGTDVGQLDIIDGAVSVDAGQAPSRVVTLTVPGIPAWVPAGATSTLDPRAQARLVLEQYVDGAWVAQGRFILAKTGIRHATGGLGITITCPDETLLVKQALLTRPVEFKAGTSVESAIGSILADRAPWLAQRLTGSGVTLPSAVVGKAGDDPWKVCDDLAGAAACELLIDVDGAAVLRKMTAPLAADVETTWATDGTSVVADLSRDLDGSEMPDGCLVVWKDGVLVVGPPDARRLVKWDGDASLVTSASQAQEIGQATLLLRRGAAEQVGATVLDAHGIDVGSVVRLIDAASGTDTTARVIGLTRHLRSPLVDVKLAARRLT